MNEQSEDLKDMIEKAFNYRGHVTLLVIGDEEVEGYMFNRDYERGCIDMFLKDSDEKRQFAIEDIKEIRLSGKDFAESYDQFLKRNEDKG